MTQLLGLPYSPWSEKARWALDARHVPYESVVYAPLVGELGLRRRLGRWSGTVSVPVLFEDDGHAIPDSTAIARWADRHGDGPVLFPKELEAEVDRFSTLSEEALDAGRRLSLARMLADDAALREMVPKGLRGVLGPLGPGVAAIGIRRTLRKYRANQVDAKVHEAALARVLDQLRAAIASAEAGTDASSARTLLGRFTFADIAMTQALAFVKPPRFGLRIGEASRRSFTDPALAERHADLLAWRDAIYEAHRPRS
jgi:glutathione S-transferase